MPKKFIQVVLCLLLWAGIIPILAPNAVPVSKAAELVYFGEEQSGVYDQLHPHTLNWTGNVLDPGGLNLYSMEYTSDASEADLIMNQYGDIGALAIRELPDQALSDPVEDDLSGFTNSLEMEQGAVYLILMHDGTYAKIRIDRILPDNGFSITKVMFTYVFEDFDAGSEDDPYGTDDTDSSGLDVGNPTVDLVDYAAVYTFEENGSITFPWEPLQGEASWDIYRSDNGAPYVKMTDFRLTEPEYTDHYTFADHLYLYKLVSYDRQGQLLSVSDAILVYIVPAGTMTPDVQSNEIWLQINNKEALVNGQPHTLDVAPFTYNGRTMIPLRFVGEALGAEVKWNNKEQSITITLGADEIVLVIDSSAAKVNGQTVMMDVPAQMYNGRTVVPIRFVSEQLNQNITFNNADQSIVITSKHADPQSQDDHDAGSAAADADYFIGDWEMWVPAGREGTSGGILSIYEDGTIAYWWNGPQVGTWELDETTGNLLLSNYKSGWEWTVTRTEDGIRVSSDGVYETGVRAD